MIQKAPPHPGVVLAAYLEEYGMSGKALADSIGCQGNRMTEIIRGHRGMSADTAIRLAQYFDETTPEYWMKVQSEYDLATAWKEYAKRRMK